MGKFGDSVHQSVRNTFILTITILSLASTARAETVDESRQHIETLSKIMNLSQSLTESDIERIRELKNLPYHQTAEAALVRLDILFIEVVNIEGNDLVRQQLITSLLELLSDHLRPQHAELFEEVKVRLINERIEFLNSMERTYLKSAEELSDKPDKQLYHTNEAKKISNANQILHKTLTRLDLIQAYAMSEGKARLPNLVEVPQSYEYWVRQHKEMYKGKENLAHALNQQVLFIEDIKRIRDYMRSNVIDQEVAIDSLLKLELDIHVKGYTRVKPAIRFLMGLPGTGKDTIAEAYVDAKYNEKGAHEKHLFRMPTIRSTNDIWGVIGSGKGYVGSDGPLPEFIQFLVEHSGGRYRYTNAKKMAVEENPSWRPGKVLPGFFAPENGVVFINEGHNWSQQAFDELLKQALEKGYVKVNGSNGGLEKIYVPITFLFATNNGISLLASRDEAGRVNGKAKTYQELLEAYELVKDNKAELKEALMEYNGRPAAGHGETLGMSEEFANRIQNEELIMMKPLGPEALQTIIKIKLNTLFETYRASQGGFGQLDLSVSDSLVRFIQEYRFNAETGARPMEGKIDAIIAEVYDAILNQELRHNGPKQIFLDLKVNEDKTRSLVFKHGLNQESILFEKVITMTITDRELEKANFKEFDRLIELPEVLGRKIFGNPEATKAIGEAVAITQMAREAYMKNRESHKKPTVFGLMGYAGLGKTQTVKELARALTGSDSFLTIDFNYVNNMQDFEKEFIGEKRGTQIIKSNFMKEYDKKRGSTMLVLLEEMANSNVELLKRLYPFFDEPVVRTFADGKERPMSNVIFLVTGNAGIEIYDSIMPMPLPRDVKISALGWIYETFIHNPIAQMEVLKKHLPVPLIGRFTRIFHYRPVNHEILRNLSQMFLSDGLKALQPKEGLVGWKVGFKSESDYFKMIDVLEREGFNFENQGRSIANYVQRNLNNSLKLLLVKNHVPENAKVVLVPKEAVSDEKGNRTFLVDVFVEGRSEPLVFEMEAQKLAHSPKENIEAHKRTAVHEAGHNITMQLLFPDKMRTSFLSIIPGVTEILNKYVFYAGVAEAENVERMEWTRQAVVQKIAITMAGAMAQKLVTKGRVDDSGKSNDIEQATNLARRAVMLFGLSSRFNLSVDPADPKALSLLSENDKRIISEETQKLVTEGDRLAEQLLKANFDLLIRLANVLLEKGKMDGNEIKDFYEAHKHLVVELKNPNAAAKPSAFARLTEGLSSWLKPSGSRTHNPEFIDGLIFTDNIANIDAIVEQERQKELERVRKAEIPLIDSELEATDRVLAPANSCNALFG